MAIVLLSGAGLLLRSFALLRDVDPGFRADGVVTFNVALPSDARYGTPDQTALFTTQLLNGIRQLPGVTSAATTFALPLTRRRVRLHVLDRRSCAGGGGQ